MVQYGKMLLERWYDEPFKSRDFSIRLLRVSLKSFLMEYLTYNIMMEADTHYDIQKREIYRIMNLLELLLFLCCVVIGMILNAFWSKRKNPHTLSSIITQQDQLISEIKVEILKGSIEDEPHSKTIEKIERRILEFDKSPWVR